MSLELQIVRNGRVLYSAPLSGVRTEGEMLALEIDEDMLDRLASIHDIASNSRRLRMMLEMVRNGGEMHFTDLLEVAENPKLVRDCMRPMVEEGMVMHEDRGSSYRTTRAGSACVLALTTALAGMMEFLEEEEENPE